MSDDVVKNSVLSKVKKLLNLASNDAATEGERDNATRMAHALLAKHNLSMSEAEAHGEAPQEKRTHDAVQTANYVWARDVAGALGSLFFCRYFMVRRGSTVKHYFVGRASNVLTAMEMTRWIVSSIQREARKNAKDAWESPAVYERNFAKGAAARICVRCAQMRREAEAASAPKASTGTALVLASVYARELSDNAAYIAANVGELRTVKTREKEPGEGYGDGVRFGNSVSLNKQVGGSGSGGIKKLPGA